MSVFGVLDGHGGAWCAFFMRHRFEIELRKQLLDPEEGIYGTKFKMLNESFNNAIVKTFRNVDEEFHLKGGSNQCGSTAVIVFIIGNHIFCANIGDSRAVLCKDGKAVNLSYDHKPQRPDEVERITKNKGYI
mmetsp:Transcript_11898/g.20120  ORF Transcript_11898/g.20120 Transcript_11898/m.20120 type:complete len:132 (-) Transcript_11898:401-796(-)